MKIGDGDCIDGKIGENEWASLALRHETGILDMWALILCILSADTQAATAPTDEQIKFYETAIRPVLAEHCLKCHGPEKQWAAFRLDSRDDLIKGGEGGA